VKLCALIVLGLVALSLGIGCSSPYGHWNEVSMPPEVGRMDSDLARAESRLTPIPLRTAQASTESVAADPPGAVQKAGEISPAAAVAPGVSLIAKPVREHAVEPGRTPSPWQATKPDSRPETRAAPVTEREPSRQPMTVTMETVLGEQPLEESRGGFRLFGWLRGSPDDDGEAADALPEPARPDRESAEAPAQATADAAAEALPVNGERTIQPGMLVRLLVMVVDKPEVDVDEVRVSEDGNLFLPLLREVLIAGRTFDQATAYLTPLYAKFFIRPDVYLHRIPGAETGDSDARGCVTVTGRVNRPGLVMVPAALDLTVSQAILKSGGLNTSAKDRAVRVARRQPDGTVKQVIVDLRSILVGGKLDRDIVLRAGDVIYVPESLF